MISNIIFDIPITTSFRGKRYFLSIEELRDFYNEWHDKVLASKANAGSVETPTLSLQPINLTLTNPNEGIPSPVKLGGIESPSKEGDLKVHDNIAKNLLLDAETKLKQTLQEATKKAANLNKMGNVALVAGLAFDIAKNFTNVDSSVQSDTYNTVTSAANGVADVAANFGPWGMAAAGIIKGALFANEAFGHKVDEFHADKEMLSSMGGSYAGATGDIMKGDQMGGKKFGVFSFGGEDKARNAISKAKIEQSTLLDINNKQQDKLAILQSQGDLIAKQKELELNGGIDFNKIRSGKEGMQLSKDIFNKVKKAQSRVKLPKSLKLDSEKLKATTVDFLNLFKENLNLLQLELKQSEEEGGSSFYDSDDYVSTLTPYGTEIVNGQLMYRYKDLFGEILLYDNPIPEEKLLSLEISEFKLGGLLNVIPEGALHARLNHMDSEDITKKGIPVISEDEKGKVTQHAEIERNEIIFNKEVTNKLEQWCKEYFSEDTKNKDQIAIEAGKLLSEEIMTNTDDRTGLINEIQ